ncbi:hypothetical protein Goshw_003809 [Gossypium schwendimanii]|uniref:RNase H type-1 domain-containing protein n=1 Tax=Gossypium schwendimanii TaxID=34291 RepID=A0A7J9N9W3_GOSSC|nr:hypothetical protein [Gossypium schwendimanii]
MESPSGYAIKINFNGAYNGHNFRSTLRIIARNVEGRVLISCLEIHNGVSTVFSFEALTCQRAVQMGLEMGWSEVTVEGDSLAIIKKCQTHNPNKSQIGAHIQDIQQLKDSFQSIVFKHTPRLANGLAHILAIETQKKSKTDYLVGGAPVYAERVMVVEWVREPD